MMKEPSRREFIKQAGVIGLASTTLMGQIACSNPVSNQLVSSDADSISKLDPTVSKDTGPHGKGLPITMAGYEYSRVRGLIDGSVTVEGCSTNFEVTGIGPLNKPCFLWGRKPVM